MLTLGTGVGGGLVLGGRPFRGWAELGHIVIGSDGPPCQGSCTGRGHLEALCSGLAADARPAPCSGRAPRPTSSSHTRRKATRAPRGARRDRAPPRGGIGAWSTCSRRARRRRRRVRARCRRFSLPDPAREVARREVLEPLDERSDRHGEPGQRRRPRRRRPGRASRRSTSRLDAVRSARRRSATSRTSPCVSSASSRGGARALRGHAGRQGPPRPSRDRGAARQHHQQNEARRIAELLPRLVAGERIALVRDAGLPGVNDPGGRLIAAALDAGVPVTVLPGPSAVETALVASGLVGERYQFLGYLPRGRRARRALDRARGLAAPRGRVRVASAAARHASRARGGVPRAAGGRLPRADEAVRGGRARDRARNSRRGSPSRRKVRSHSSSGPRRRAAGERRGRRWRRVELVGRACRAARPPMSSLGWRAFLVTLSIRNR